MRYCTLFSTIDVGTIQALPSKKLSMSVGSNSRNQANQANLQALRNQNRIANDAEARMREYGANYDTRNASVIGIHDRADSRLTRFDQGKDIGSIYPLLANALSQASETIKNTTRFTQGLGSDALRTNQDKDYRYKVQQSSSRQIARGMGGLLAQGAVGERNQDLNTVLNTSAYLQQDRLAGVGMYNTMFNQRTQITADSANRLQMERARSQQAMSQIGMFVGMAQGFAGTMMTGGLSNALSGATSGASGMAQAGAGLTSAPINYSNGIFGAGGSTGGWTS